MLYSTAVISESTSAPNTGRQKKDLEKNRTSKLSDPQPLPLAGWRPAPAGLLGEEEPRRAGEGEENERGAEPHGPAPVPVPRLLRSAEAEREFPGLERCKSVKNVYILSNAA